MKKKLIIIIIGILFLIPMNTKTLDKNINIYLFYGKECPHCEGLIKYFDNYTKENKQIILYKYEVWHNNNNQNIFQKVQNILDQKATGVPYLVVGTKVITGFMEGYTESIIEDSIDYYSKNDYKDVVGEELGIVEKTNKEVNNAKTDTLKVPVFGKIDPKTASLPLLAIVIGFIDGFNPCAMWVLFFLISMLLGMKDKKKMWILGLTFLFTSGIVYLLFMMSWLSFAELTNKVVIVRIIIGLFAIVFGIFNLLKYYKSKNNTGCEVTTQKDRKKIMTKINNIIHEKKFILSILGIVLLAISVNVIELLCSLGLPVLYTQILSMNHLSSIEYMIYLMIYILFFMIDDIIIFALSMSALKIKAISNKYTKYSHLIGGIIMLIIGILMIFIPKWLMFNF